MLKLAINGACGRMGLRIVTLAHESPVFQVAAATDAADHPLQGHDIGALAGIGQLDLPVTETPAQKPDVMIDFSIPIGTLVAAQYCQENRVPLVVGTTGLGDAQLDALTKLSQSAPVVIGSNMSLGMNLMFKLVADIAARLDDGYDIEIVETHHRFKRDAPLRHRTLTRKSRRPSP